MPIFFEQLVCLQEQEQAEGGGMLPGWLAGSGLDAGDCVLRHAQQTAYLLLGEAQRLAGLAELI